MGINRFSAIRTSSIYALAIVCIASPVLNAAASGGVTPPSMRRFTVRDSIEMSRFGRVDHDPILSPDGTRCAVVTSRGVMATNQVESSLWLFNVSTVRQHLRTHEAAALAPKLVTTLAVVPTIPYTSSYEPIITDIRWAPDSKGIFFLGQNPLARRQLYRADIVSGRTRALTTPELDVSQFDVAAGTIVYRVTEFERSRPRGEPVNVDAYDITGNTIESILFPHEHDPSGQSQLWVNQRLRNRAIIDASTGHPLQLWDLPPVIWNTLSISPDGKAVVLLSPVKDVPQSWERYDPKYAFQKIHSGDPRLTADARFNVSRLTEYAIVDLTNGKTELLVNAPNGWALGYGDRNRAIWSIDGKKLLLINTYLPLESDSHDSPQRTRPCAAAIVDLRSRSNSCVSYGENRQVTGAWLGETDGAVVLWFGNDPVGQKFDFQDGVWKRRAGSPMPPTACKGPYQDRGPAADFSIRVEQGLNDPPALFAEDCLTGQKGKVWDPNPQLAGMALGEASVFRWKDPTGYEWKGVLQRPPDFDPRKRYPLVIEPYGFEENEFLTDGEDTTAFATRPLSAAGMMVLQFWPRFDHAGTDAEGSDALLGYESAIEYLVSEGLVDSTRVGIIGFSLTCYHVESALINHGALFAAATLADGKDESYLQYLLFLGVGRASDEAERINGGRPFGDGLRKWVEKAPGFRLDRIKTPLRIEAIGPVSVLTEWETYASLRLQRKPVDFIYIPGGQHILQKPLDRMASQQGNVDWFRFWLKGEEDSDPAKAEQYKRWRELRKLQQASTTSTTQPN